MTRRIERRLRWLAFFALLVAVPARASEPCVREGRYVMGTILQATICGGDPRGDAEKMFDVARRLDASFTTFAPDSPVLRLNAASGTGSSPVPAELRRILEESVGYSHLTHGAFDVTVGPLVALWKEAARTRTQPTTREIGEALARVGSDKIGLEPGGSIGLARTGMAVDLGGIGKGFALDRIAETVDLRSYDGILLDFGGSSWLARGTPPDAPSWRILLESPGGVPLGIVSLRDRALSVSGSYPHDADDGGERRPHIVDPRSGRLVEQDRMAWVLAPDAALAEALTKALVVEGGERGIPALEGIAGVDALVIDADGRTWRTDGFDRAVELEPRGAKVGSAGGR